MQAFPLHADGALEPRRGVLIHVVAERVERFEGLLAVVAQVGGSLGAVVAFQGVLPELVDVRGNVGAIGALVELLRLFGLRLLRHRGRELVAGEDLLEVRDLLQRIGQFLLDPRELRVGRRELCQVQVAARVKVPREHVRIL